jgi:putative Ca2+/H+ antiporter (TMEM165/GDT1 family)
MPDNMFSSGHLGNQIDDRVQVALIVTSALDVIAGTFLSNYVSEKLLHYVAGIGFIAIGIGTLIKA